MKSLETGTSELLARVEGPTGWLAINRPARRNALSAEIWAAIPAAMAALAAEPGVRVIILRGAGEEAFAAGADISEFSENRADASAAKLYAARNEAALASISGCGKPVIAMIHGFCIGGGLAVALACDMRIASEAAQFALPPAKLGLAYPLGGLKQLLQAVSPAVARDMIFTARRVDAPDALRIGLINRIVPKHGLEALVRETAAILAENAPLSITAAKGMIAAIAGGGQVDEAEMERLAAICFDSADYAEGRAAFLDKRKPVFTGR